MKIAFNGIGCGWGNNGGTQSVFRMADALNELGVETEMWAHCPSRFTWFKPKTPVRVCTLDNAPAVDVLINAGCNTTMSTYNYPRKKVGVQWLRGHEVWAKSDSQLRKLYNLPMVLWTNSEWLSDMVKDMTDVQYADVQYCGIPVDDFYKVSRSTDGVRVGALWSTKPLKRGQLALDIFNDPKLAGCKFVMFGNEPGPPGVEYIQQPTMEQKRKLMSMCDIWLATSEMEGLHIPPMEAALCGATIIAPARPQAGVSDYCINGLSGLTYASHSSAVECIRRLHDVPLRNDMNVRALSLIRDKVGDVDMNAKRMIERLEKELL